MKISALAATVGFLAALVAAPAMAGQPNEPGSGSAKEAVADAKAADMTLGEARKLVEEYTPNFGQTRKFEQTNGRPDASKDNGKGNDW